MSEPIKVKVTITAIPDGRTLEQFTVMVDPDIGYEFDADLSEAIREVIESDFDNVEGVC